MLGRRCRVTLRGWLQTARSAAGQESLMIGHFGPPYAPASAPGSKCSKRQRRRVGQSGPPRCSLQYDRLLPTRQYSAPGLTNAAHHIAASTSSRLHCRDRLPGHVGTSTIRCNPIELEAMRLVAVTMPRSCGWMIRSRKPCHDQRNGTTETSSRGLHGHLIEEIAVFRL